MSDTGTALATVAQNSSGMTNMLLSSTGLDNLQRAAAMFAASPLVPQHLKGANKAEGIANCAIVLAMAHEMNANPLIVMQGLHVIKGKAGWAAQYMISRANASGLLKGRIRWRVTGKGPTLEVTAYARLADDPAEEITASASMEMAKAEGWTSNSKYRTMPEHMLRWRSATFLIRLYMPEVMMGYRTADEIEDMGAREPRDVTPPHERSAESQRATAVIVDALGLDDEPEVVEPPVECEAEIVAPDGSEQAGFEWAPEEGE